MDVRELIPSSMKGGKRKQAKTMKSLKNLFQPSSSSSSKPHSSSRKSKKKNKQNKQKKNPPDDAHVEEAPTAPQALAEGATTGPLEAERSASSLSPLCASLSPRVERWNSIKNLSRKPSIMKGQLPPELELQRDPTVSEREEPVDQNNSNSTFNSSSSSLQKSSGPNSDRLLRLHQQRIQQRRPSASCRTLSNVAASSSSSPPPSLGGGEGKPSSSSRHVLSASTHHRHSNKHHTAASSDRTLTSRSVHTSSSNRLSQTDWSSRLGSNRSSSSSHRNSSRRSIRSSPFDSSSGRIRNSNAKSDNQDSSTRSEGYHSTMTRTNLTGNFLDESSRHTLDDFDKIGEFGSDTEKENDNDNDETNNTNRVEDDVNDDDADKNQETEDENDNDAKKAVTNSALKTTKKSILLNTTPTASSRSRSNGSSSMPTPRSSRRRSSSGTKPASSRSRRSRSNNRRRRSGDHRNTTTTTTTTNNRRSSSVEEVGVRNDDAAENHNEEEGKSPTGNNLLSSSTKTSTDNQILKQSVRGRRSRPKSKDTHTSRRTRQTSTRSSSNTNNRRRNRSQSKRKGSISNSMHNLPARSRRSKSNERRRPRNRATSTTNTSGAGVVVVRSEIHTGIQKLYASGGSSIPSEGETTVVRSNSTPPQPQHHPVALSDDNFVTESHREEESPHRKQKQGEDNHTISTRMDDAPVPADVGRTERRTRRLQELSKSSTRNSRSNDRTRHRCRRSSRNSGRLKERENNADDPCSRSPTKSTPPSFLPVINHQEHHEDDDDDNDNGNMNDHPDKIPTNQSASLHEKLSAVASQGIVIVGDEDEMDTENIDSRPHDFLNDSVQSSGEGTEEKVKETDACVFRNDGDGVTVKDNSNLRVVDLAQDNERSTTMPNKGNHVLSGSTASNEKEMEREIEKKNEKNRNGINDQRRSQIRKSRREQKIESSRRQNTAVDDNPTITSVDPKINDGVGSRKVKKKTQKSLFDLLSKSEGSTRKKKLHHRRNPSGDSDSLLPPPSLVSTDAVDMGNITYDQRSQSFTTFSDRDLPTANDLFGSLDDHNKSTYSRSKQDKDAAVAASAESLTLPCIPFLDDETDEKSETTMDNDGNRITKSGFSGCIGTSTATQSSIETELLQMLSTSYKSNEEETDLNSKETVNSDFVQFDPNNSDLVQEPHGCDHTGEDCDDDNGDDNATHIFNDEGDDHEVIPEDKHEGNTSATIGDDKIADLITTKKQQRKNGGVLSRMRKVSMKKAASTRNQFEQATKKVFARGKEEGKGLLTRTNSDDC